MIKIKTLADAKRLEGDHVFLRPHIPHSTSSQTAKYSDKLVHFKDQQPSILKHPEFLPPRHIKANAAFSMCPWNFEGCESIEDVLNCSSSDDWEGFK